jgi:hypothetical protein
MQFNNEHHGILLFTRGSITFCFREENIKRPPRVNIIRRKGILSKSQNSPSSKHNNNPGSNSTEKK